MTIFQQSFGGRPLGDQRSIRGSRTWVIDSRGRLIGQNSFIWRPGENTAVCEVMQRVVPIPESSFFAGTWLPIRRIPDPAVGDYSVERGCSGAESHCKCGFYSYFTELSRLRDNARAIGAVGVIEGYGKTTVGVAGFRTMKAKILALCLAGLPHKTASFPTQTEQIQRNYPDVAFFTDETPMYKEFPLGKPPLFDPDEPDFWDRSIDWG